MTDEAGIKTNSAASLTGTFGFFALILLAFTVVIGLVLTNISLNPDEFALRFNGFAVVSAVAVAANLVVLFSLLSLRPRTEASVWFRFYVGGAAFFGVCEMFQRLSARPDGAMFWATLSAVGIAVVPLALFMFASSYAGKMKRYITLIPLFIIATSVVIFFNANGGTIFTTDPGTIRQWPWGFNDAIGPAFIFHAAWLSILDGSAIYILLRIYISTQESLLRRQAFVFSLAVALPWAAATISDGILPLFGITLMPIAVATTTLTGVIIMYGLRRYQLFRIDQELLSESILSTMKEAVIVTRPDFSIDMFNSEAAVLLGQPQNRLYHRSLKEFFSEDGWQQMQEKQLKAMGPHAAGGYQTRLTGTDTPVRVIISVLNELGTGMGYVFVIADVTELAESYDKLEAEKRNVEHVVEVRTEALRKAHEELQAADQLKTEFMMIASHNLRTPLTVITGYLGMAKQQASSSPELLNMINSIEAHSRRLSMFAEDLLIISSIEAGEKVFTNQDYFDADDFVKDIAADFAVMAREKNVRFVSEPPALHTNLFGSKMHLRSAVWNLLDNALKFTDSGGTVTLGTVRSGDAVRLTIADTGIGIGPAEMDKLFTKFHRGTDTLAYNYDGTGIGLYVTKLIITQHKGSIDVHSQLGQGTSIDITLPAANSTERAGSGTRRTGMN